MLEETLLLLNNNKILWGVSMILLNLGSKYIMADLGKAHEKLLKQEFFKKIILFSMFFVATRDIVTTFLLTCVYVIVVDGILHEDRNFSIMSDKEGDTNTTYQNYLHNIKLLH
jgi:uncharacterized membrane protein (DUF485 family)